MSEQIPIKIAGVEVEPAKAKNHRLSMLLWGPSGSGKTTLAATAPGKKLLISFDPDGAASIANRDDVDVVDLSAAKPMITEKFKQDNVLGLASSLEAYDTIIVDSLTSVAQLCLMQGIGSVKGATIERPSPGAYGVRNALTLQLVMNMLRLTGRENKHVIFIAHEATPVTNDDGVVLFITVMLGGQLPEQASLNFSECWNLSDTGRERRIAIRNVRQRKPMKSRMFDSSKTAEFKLTYDADKLKGDGIGEWFEAWKEAGFKKIPVPS